MIDPRIKKMAKVLVNYALDLKKEDVFAIVATHVSMPLVKEVYREALKVGAYPQVHLQSEEIVETFFKEANNDQLNYVSPIRMHMVKNADATLNIKGTNNTNNLANIDPEKMAIVTKANSELSKIFMERAGNGELKWCGCQFPTYAAAQDAKMSLDEYAEFVFEACLLNEDDPVEAWKKVHDSQQEIIDYLKDKDEIEIKSKDTHLTLKVGGRTWINSDAKNNFPSGEVFTAPIEDSIDGHIRFSFPGIYSGKEIEDIKLTFKNGKVVKAVAEKGEDLLHKLLETDEGAKMVGEFAIGTNYGIQKFTRNMLFDEKIGGTIHLALGAAYPKSGGTNKSSIHWDMLCDMKDGGEIYADGELFYKDGKFIK